MLYGDNNNNKLGENNGRHKTIYIGYFYFIY